MKKGFSRRLLLLALFCMATAGVFLLQEKTAYAVVVSPSAGAVKVVAVEYYEEQIVVLNNGNSKICFATEVEAAKDNWEVINADSGAYTWIDMSWLSTTVENIIVIKGANDIAGRQTRVIFKEKPIKLEVSINYEKLDNMSWGDSIAPLFNIMSSVGTGNSPITFDDLEWRKGTTGQWQSTRTLKVHSIEKYLVKGTYLYFRIRAVDDVVTTTDADGNEYDFNYERYMGNGGFSYIVGTGETLDNDYPDGTEGRRFSNEVKVKVAKKASPMVYGVDGEDFTAEIKYGKEYRVTVGTTTTDWIKVTDRATKSIPLSTILMNIPAYTGGGLINTSSNTYYGYNPLRAFPAMKIEVRDYATTKSASSKITEIYLKAQRTITADPIIGKAPVDAIINEDRNIYLYYNGNKNMVLEIPQATPELPYEYAVAKPTENLDPTKLVWAAVTKGTEVKILASKAVEGYMLIIRQKEIKSKEATENSRAVDYALASTIVFHPVSYPSIPEIVDNGYTFTKGGYSGAITFTATLNASGKSPFETAVRSIKLGTKDIGFTTSTATVNGISTMTITLKADSLSTMTNCYAKAITITYMNNTVDKTSVKLTIQSPIAAANITLNVKKGTNTGTTAFEVSTPKAAGNSWVYVITAAAIDDVYTLDKLADVTSVVGTTITSPTYDNLTIAANQYLTVFDVDATGYIQKYKCFKITTDYIK